MDAKFEASLDEIVPNWVELALPRGLEAPDLSSRAVMEGLISIFG